MEKVDIGHGLSVQIVQVTPERAKKWLLKNDEDNRNLNTSRVTSYATDMRNGNWELNHQGICFGADETLIDGQHRLHAVIEADVTVLMVVFYDNRGTVQDALDIGMKRSLAYVTQTDAKIVSGINVLRMLVTGYSTTTPMTPSECMEIAEKYANGLEAIQKLPNRGKLYGGEFGAIVYALPIDERAVLDFANKFITGEMIKKGDPAFAMRRFKELNSRLTPWPLAMATLNCLNYHIRGKPLNSVFTGEMGYRTLTQRRRAMRIPHTPNTNLVPTTGGSEKAEGE